MCGTVVMRTGLGSGKGNMPRILITGGLGYVGSELLTQIHTREDLDILVYDNGMSRPDRRNFSTVLQNITLIQGDIRDTQLLREALAGVDIIVHLAGIVGFPACDIDTSFSYDVNVNGTHTLLNLMHGDQKIIFMSSNSSYGEKPGIYVTEDIPLDPLTSYGVHKKIGEVLVQRSLVDHIIFRPATAFGTSKQIRVDVLPNTLSFDAITKKHLEVFQPGVIRSFVHVSDFAAAIVHAIDGKMTWNEIYNVGNPDLTVSKAALARTISGLAGATMSIRGGEDPDKRNYYTSFDKLLATGFTPKAGFERGFVEIQKNINRIKRDPERCTTPGNVRKFLAR